MVNLKLIWVRNTCCQQFFDVVGGFVFFTGGQEFGSYAWVINWQQNKVEMCVRFHKFCNQNNNNQDYIISNGETRILKFSKSTFLFLY